MSYKNDRALLEALKQLPTLQQGHSMNLKLDVDEDGRHTRIWVCRVSDTIYIEQFRNGKWVEVQ